MGQIRCTRGLIHTRPGRKKPAENQPGETLQVCTYEIRACNTYRRIVLNVPKFRIQILCSFHCAMCRSARTIEVLRLSV